MNQRFSQVFGPCGFLHFFFPFLPFEAPLVDEGYRRIITYNSDYVVDGMVVTNHREEETLALLENTEAWEWWSWWAVPNILVINIVFTHISSRPIPIKKSYWIVLTNT